MKPRIWNFDRKALAAAAFLVAPLASQAKDVVVAPPADSGWKTAIQAGVGLKDGNTDTLDIHAGILADRVTSADEIHLGAHFFYAEDKGTNTAESVSAFAQYNRLLNERLYLGLFAGFQYDDIAAVDYRVSVGPLLGYYLIKTERTTLALEAGVAYQWEDVGGVADDFATLRFGQRLTHKLTDTLTFFESVSFSPAIDDWDNFVLTADVGIETPLTDRLSLRIFAQDRFDNVPAAGLQKNDIGVYSAISYGLGAPAPAPAGAKSPAPVISDGAWDVDLAAGGSFRNGNSDTLAVAADLLAKRITTADETFFGLGGGYGETAGVRNQERVYAFGQYNKMLSDRLYAGARTDFLYDDISAVDYRVTPSVFIGSYLIKNDSTQFALEAGPSYTWEKVGGVESDYFGVFVGERFSLQVNDRVKLWQSARLILDVNDTDNYVIDAQAGLDVKVGEKLSLRTAVRDIYDGVPASGLKANDFILTSGLVWSF